MHVKITKRPAGEAPEWVRDAWIGLYLPLAIQHLAKYCATTGVVTGPHGRLGQIMAFITGNTVRIRGYVVHAKDAIDLLAISYPQAADWWRQNASSLIAQGRYFVFDADSCELLID